jgi:GAF domain-containing protein
LGQALSDEMTTVEKQIVSEENEKPVFDEETLGRLLEAAYVLQEHSQRVREEIAQRGEASAIATQSEQTPAIATHVAKPTEKTPEIPVPAATAKDDYTLTLAQIVEVQHQIQLRRLALDDVMTLVAERVCEITRAAGAAVGILKDGTVGYRAACGSMTVPKGTDVPIEKALCAASLRTGQVIRCAHINAEFLVDAEECRRRGIQSLIVVPVYHEGGVAGALELYYPAAQSFSEQDVHTCQLMAGLITEALARAEEQTWKQSLAEERAAMMEALEKLKPNLTALMDASGALQESTPQTEVKPAESKAESIATEIKVPMGVTASSPPAVVCHKCGNQLVGEEQFCGTCGLPRSSDYEPPSMQSKVASLWHMQEEAERKKNSAGPENEEDIDALVSNEILAAKNLPSLMLEGESQITAQIEGRDDVADANEIGSEEKALADPKQTSYWSSAASARDFFEQLATRPGAFGRFWNARRGDIYLGIAVVLVIAVIRWGIWSNHPVGASGNQPTPPAQSKPAPAPDSNLSIFDRMLISLGLAEAPEPPESKGNPETQVWVDLQTALYYCPGADLYGKTPKGKFSSQRDAQLDQFEPASRKTCN